MILIWDNGGDYSDHTIYFVDCTPLSVDDVVSFASIATGYLSGGYEIARCERIEWRVKRAMAKPFDLAGDIYALFDEDEDCDISGITTPALAYLIHAFPHSISSRVRDEYARRLARL